MVLLSTALKAFTGPISEVKSMLRICARNLYEWQSEQSEFLVMNCALDEM